MRRVVVVCVLSNGSLLLGTPLLHASQLTYAPGPSRMKNLCRYFPVSARLHFRDQFASVQQQQQLSRTERVATNRRTNGSFSSEEDKTPNRRTTVINHDWRKEPQPFASQSPPVPKDPKIQSTYVELEEDDSTADAGCHVCEETSSDKTVKNVSFIMARISASS